jgi:hypothetical protein
LGFLIGSTLPVLSQEPIQFPTFSPDDPVRVAIIGQLSPQQRASMAQSLDAADTEGYFPPALMAQGTDDYGIALYLLKSWEQAQQIPTRFLPAAAAQQLEGLDPSLFRYVIPIERTPGDVGILIFYTLSAPAKPLFDCVAEDLVTLITAGITSNVTAACTKK